MKKLIAFLLALVMVFALVACSSGETAQTNDTPAQTGSETVKAVFCSAKNNESQAFAQKMFEKHMAEYGFQVDFLDDQGDAAKQADNVQQAAASGYKWIIVNPTDAAGIVTTLKSVKENYPDVIISTFSADVPDGESEQYRDFFVGINDTDVGKIAAQAFINMFPDGCKMVEIGGQAGHNAQVLRHEGFMEVMKDHPEFEILDCQNCEHWAADEAQTIAEDMVTKFGDEIEAIYCHWDNGVTGVYNATNAAGLDVPILGVDGCRAGFEQVQQGIQCATVMNNFETDAITSMELAQKVLAGESVPSDNYITADIVTIDNINDFTMPEW